MPTPALYKYWYRQQQAEKKQAEKDEVQKKYHSERYKMQKEEILSQQKEYREANKEKIKARPKEYRDKNRDKINAKGKDKIECDNCGAMVTRKNILQHKMTLNTQPSSLFLRLFFSYSARLCCPSRSRQECSSSC